MDEKQLVDGATALAEKQSRVIKIEPAEQPQNMLLRVAAYTRVSSDSEDQLNSFAAQNRYYTELISGKAECCTNHDAKGDCLITPIRETQIYESFCRLYYKLKHQSIPILEQMLTNLQMIRNRRMLWSPDIVALNKRISDLSSQNQTLAFLKQQGLVDPDIFIAKTNELTKQLRQVKLEKEKLMDAESDMTALQTRDLIDLLEGGPEFLDSFDTELFGELVEKIIIEGNDSVRFCLKNGLELQESIERTVR